MFNFRCSIEHSTLNIEHCGYCRFTRRGADFSIAFIVRLSVGYTNRWAGNRKMSGGLSLV